MANIFEINRPANKITLGTTDTTINIASHTASKILALDGSKDLEVVTIGSSLDYTRPTLNTVQDIQTTASPEFAGGTFTGVVIGVTPTAGTHFATKEYVDLAIGTRDTFFLSDTGSGVGDLNYAYQHETTDVESTIVNDGVDEEYGVGARVHKGFITEVGQPATTILTSGVISFDIHAKKGNSNQRDTVIHAILSYVDADGTTGKTTIATSETTAELIDVETIYHIHASLAEEVEIADTARLILDVYVTVSGVGQDVVVTLYLEGTHDSHFQIGIAGGVWQNWGAVLDDLNTVGQVGADSEFLVGTGIGALAWENAATARTSLGLGTGDSPLFASISIGNVDTTITRVSGGVIAVEGTTVMLVGDAPTSHTHDDRYYTETEIGDNYQPLDAVLTDLAALAAVANDEFIVGTGAGVYAHESGTTVRTSMGLGTTDIPQFRGLGLGEAGGIGEIQITGSANHIHRVDMENTSNGNAARAGFTARSDEASFTADAYSSNHASSPNMVTFRADTDTDFRIQNFGIGASLGTITIVVGAEFMITPVAGSGYFTFTGTDVRLGDFCELRFYDDGANYVGFKAPALTANKIWVLPDADGGANELLKTDGSGNLSWTATAPPGAHMHDGDTLQLDAINSNGGAFAFTTSGIVTFSESVTMSSGKDLTIAGHIIFNTNNSYIGFNNPRITFNDTDSRLDIIGGIIGSATATFEGASVTVGKASTTTGTIVLHDSNSANTITLTVPDITAGSLTFTLPPTDGDNTNVLQTDGNGVLTWIAAGGAGADEKVGIDSGATAGYLGQTNSNGVLRTGAGLSYTDGGNFVTLDVVGFGDYTDEDDDNATMLVGHAYLANQDGFVVVQQTTQGAMDIIGYVDTDNNPVVGGTIAGRMVILSALGNFDVHTMMFPVASGKYFEITSANGTQVIRWHPVGTLIKPTDQN